MAKGPWMTSVSVALPVSTPLSVSVALPVPVGVPVSVGVAAEDDVPVFPPAVRPDDRVQEEKAMKAGY